MSTVAEIFKKLGLVAWWEPSLVTQGYGQNGEQGTDFGLSGAAPIGSISSGRVVYVGDGGYPGSSIGQIVQVLSDNGMLLHYQHLKSSSVSIGQTVSIGTVLGTSGGCPVGAYPASGGTCSRTDNFTTGQHIEVRQAPTYSASGGVWQQAWNSQNLSIFAQLAQGVANAVASPSTSTTGFFPDLPKLPEIPKAVLDWLNNPVRVIKMIAGLMLIGISIFLAVAPEVLEEFIKASVSK